MESIHPVKLRYAMEGLEEMPEEEINYFLDTGQG